MEKKDYKLIKCKVLSVNTKTLIITFLSFCFCIQFSFGSDILIWPKEIKFNYDNTGYSNDAITLKEDNNNYVPIPEWIKDGINEKCAYIKGQSNRKIQVKFDSNSDNMNFLIKTTVIAGEGIGAVCEAFISECDLDENRWITLDLTGSLPISIGKRTFTWKWEATALPMNSPYCPIVCEPCTTTHTYYTLLAAPNDPKIEPRVDILEYASSWASGKSDANSICIDILSNGFNAHYTWNMDCHMLSSDFVRLVTSLGISASLHRWSSKNQNIGDMCYQRTKSIDPVGPTWGQGQIEWAWHQWAEAASSQRDPSANTSLPGGWGGYEDNLFTQYLEKIGSYQYQWVANQSGQSSGCEAPEHRYYYYSSSAPWTLLYDWRGPDR